jgi:hypothetical protein
VAFESAFGRVGRITNKSKRVGRVQYLPVSVYFRRAGEMLRVSVSFLPPLFYMPHQQSDLACAVRHPHKRRAAHPLVLAPIVPFALSSTDVRWYGRVLQVHAAISGFTQPTPMELQLRIHVRYHCSSLGLKCDPA